MLDINLLSKIATDMLYEKQNSKENPSENFGEYTKGALDLVAELEDYLVNDDEEKEPSFFENNVEAIEKRFKERCLKLDQLYISHGYTKLDGYELVFQKHKENGGYSHSKLAPIHIRLESDEEFERRMEFLKEKLNESK